MPRSVTPTISAADAEAGARAHPDRTGQHPCRKAHRNPCNNSKISRVHRANSSNSNADRMDSSHGKISRARNSNHNNQASNRGSNLVRALHRKRSVATITGADAGARTDHDRKGQPRRSRSRKREEMLKTYDAKVLF